MPQFSKWTIARTGPSWVQSRSTDGGRQHHWNKPILQRNAKNTCTGHTYTGQTIRCTKSRNWEVNAKTDYPSLKWVSNRHYCVAIVILSNVRITPVVCNLFSLQNTSKVTVSQSMERTTYKQLIHIAAPQDDYSSFIFSNIKLNENGPLSSVRAKSTWSNSFYGKYTANYFFEKNLKLLVHSQYSNYLIT